MGFGNMGFVDVSFLVRFQDDGERRVLVFCEGKIYCVL